MLCVCMCVCMIAKKRMKERDMKHFFLDVYIVQQRHKIK